MNLPVENLNPYQKKLLDAFEASISATGFTVFLFRNPKAPNLMLSRNPMTPKVVPVLVAGISIGGEAANLELGGKLYLQIKIALLCFSPVSTGCLNQFISAFYGLRKSKLYSSLWQCNKSLKEFIKGI